MDKHNGESEPMEKNDDENNMDEAQRQRELTGASGRPEQLPLGDQGLEHGGETQSAAGEMTGASKGPEQLPPGDQGLEHGGETQSAAGNHKNIKDKELWKQTIRASGKTFLLVFQRLLRETDADKEKMFQYMQKMYHSIFFYGYINEPRVEPREFLPAEAWDNLQKAFPKPLAEYNTHLPRQTPYSILLEYITKHYAGEKDLILKELEKRNKEFLKNFYDDEKNQLKPNDFALSAAVISYSCANGTNAFGSLIAYKGSVPTRIMIAISSLFVWDKVISYVVRCGSSGTGIVFPSEVFCYSYKFEIENDKFKETPPCANCNKMFIVTFDPKCVETKEKEDWPYGNCAETESLSNLIRDNENIKDAIHINDKFNNTIGNRATIIQRFASEHERRLKKTVKNLLSSRKFRVIKNNFLLFTPAALAHR